MLKIAIVDDEAIICEQLERFVTAYCAAILMPLLTEVYFSGETISQKLSQGERYDIILLDIELTECTGIDVAQLVRDKLLDETTQIVFVSGKNQYDRQLFAYRPFCFVPKPVDQATIAQMLDKYLRIYGARTSAFYCNSERHTQYIPFEQILYFYYSKRRIVIELTNGKQISFYDTMENVQKQTEKHGFIMTHQSFIINYRYIRTFFPDYILLTNNAKIPIARSRKDELAKIQIALENGGVL